MIDSLFLLQSNMQFLRTKIAQDKEYIKEREENGNVEINEFIDQVEQRATSTLKEELKRAYDEKYKNERGNASSSGSGMNSILSLEIFLLNHCLYISGDDQQLSRNTDLDEQQKVMCEVYIFNVL